MHRGVQLWMPQQVLLAKLSTGRSSMYTTKFSTENLALECIHLGTQDGSYYVYLGARPVHARTTSCVPARTAYPGTGVPYAHRST
jgi:hypothetical protein